MPDTCTGSQTLAACLRIPVIIMALLISACATQHSSILEVNPQHDAGRQYTPQELTRMMTELGYRQLRVADPVTGQSVTVAEKYGEYRMLFQSLDNDAIRVDIHIVKSDGRIALYFYNIDKTPLNRSSQQLYEQLHERLRFEYGADNVSSHQAAQGS